MRSCFSDGIFAIFSDVMKGFLRDTGKVILSNALRASGRVYFKFGDVKLKEPLRKGASEVRFENVRLQNGLGKVEAWAEVEGEKLGVRFVNIERLD